MLYAFLFDTMRATCSAQFLHVSILIILCYTLLRIGCQGPSLNEVSGRAQLLRVAICCRCKNRKKESSGMLRSVVLVSSSETSVLTRVTLRNIPVHDILHSGRRENLKSYIALTGWAV
jgi:hypothetical protein